MRGKENMDSFNALRIDEHDRKVVSGSVHQDEGRLDFDNVPSRLAYSGFVEIGGAANG